MMNFTLKSALMAASALVLLGSLPAQAGADAVRAEAYFNAISGGNADTITSFYADDAEFHWIGGPLDGKHKGKAKIKSVWEKFSKAAGKLDHKVLELSESANGKTSTVTARVMFKADSEVPVKFIMIYKDGKIVSEVWQVDRPVAVEAKAEGTPAPAAPVPAADAGNQPQRKAANAPAADAPAPDAAPAEKTPEAQNAPGAQAPEAAPAATEQPAVTAPEKTFKSAAQPKAKYAEEKRGYGYEKRTYKRRKPYYGHGYGHGHGGYGGYGHGHGGYGRGYGHY